LTGDKESLLSSTNNCGDDGLSSSQDIPLVSHKYGYNVDGLMVGLFSLYIS
jgi:hypothetical protein